MAYETDGTNPYLSNTISLFKERHAKKRQMESDFKPEYMQEYSELITEYTKLGAELLKFGVPNKLNDNMVIICLDDEEYGVPKKDLLKEMGDRQWDIIFPADKTCERIDESEYIEVDERDYQGTSNEPNSHYGQFGNIPPAPQPAIINPLGTLLSALISPFITSVYGNGSAQNVFNPRYGQQPPPPPQREYRRAGAAPNKNTDINTHSGSDILDDFSGLQRKIVLLEKERDGAKGSASEIEKKYNELKKNTDERIEQLEKEKEASAIDNKALTEKVSSLEDARAKEAENNEKLKAEFNKKQTQFASQISKLQQTNNDLSSNAKREKDSLVSQLQNLKNNETKLKETADKEAAQFKERISRLESKNAELENNAIESAKKAAQDLAAAIEKTRSEGQSETANVKAEISAKAENERKESEKRYAELENKYKQEAGKTEDLAKRNEEFRTKLNNAYSEKNEINSKLSQSVKERDKLNEQIKRLNEQLQKSENEKKQAEAKNNKLEDQNRKLEEQIEKLQTADTEKEAYYKKLEDERNKLEILAYRDTKTDVMNVNAFNRDFSTCDKNSTVLIRVGIRDMRNINGMYGRETGDTVINKVAAQLSSVYGKDKTYRTLGDQFAVIVPNGIQNNVISQMINIKQTLANGNIEIVFGVAAGNMTPTLKELLVSAENMMNQMKSGNAPYTGNAAQPASSVQIYQMPADNGYQQPKPVNTSVPEEMDMDKLISEYMQTKN